MATQTTHATINGMDTARMFETVSHIQSDPTLARFEFRNSNRWIQGGHNRSTIQGFYGAGREDDSRVEPFVVESGEPPILLGGNEGANPVEFLLHALAACVTSTVAIHAAARGITIHEMSTEIEGEVDLRGLLGLDEAVPAACREIRLQIHVEADCTDEELDDLLAFVQTHSPVATTISQPVPLVFSRA